MKTSEKIAAGLITLVVVWVLAMFTYAMLRGPKFCGYYLQDGYINASHSMGPDMRAFEYSDERWQMILDNNLALKPSAK